MTKKPFIILYGAGGHGKVVADALRSHGEVDIEGFLDDGKSGEFFGYPILGGMEQIPGFLKRGITAVIVTIGRGDIRQSQQEKLEAAGMMPSTAVHPSAVIARGARFGMGTVILPGAILGPDTRLGKGCIVNTAASIDHDCEIGDFTHICPGVHIAGGVRIGSGTQIGIGSSVKEGVSIGSNVMVGAGSVVIDDLPDECTAFGVPAKIKSSPKCHPSCVFFSKEAPGACGGGLLD